MKFIALQQCNVYSTGHYWDAIRNSVIAFFRHDSVASVFCPASAWTKQPAGTDDSLRNNSRLINPLPCYYDHVETAGDKPDGAA